MRIMDRPEFKSKPKPLSCAPEGNVREVVHRMSELNYGAVVVTDPDDRVLGMVTERDIMRRIVDAGRDPATTTIAEIMTADVRVAKADDSLLDWLRIMSNERFRRLPIVNEEEKLVSIMTQGDFVSYTWPDLISQAVTLTKSTVGSNYQIFFILGAILLYTLVIVGALVSGLS